MIRKTKQKEKQNYWLTITGTILTLGTLLWAFSLTMPGIRLSHSPIPLLTLVPVMFFTVLIHEIGHLIAGLIVNFRIGYFIAGPFKIVRQQQRLKLSFGRTYGLKAGGIVGFVPRGDQRLASRLIICFLGGPTANLAAGMIAAGISAINGVEGWTRFVVVYFAAYSICQFLLNMLPFESGGLASDGKTILTLWKGGSQAQFILAHFALEAASLAGIRPREWDTRLVKQALAIQDGSAREATSMLLAYYHELDSCNLASAGDYLDKAMALREKYPLANRATLYLEAAYFEACCRNDAVIAREWFCQAEGGILIEPQSRLIAEAAVLLAEGNNEEAVQKAEEALSFLDKSIDPGEAIMMRDLLREIVQLAQAHQSATRRESFLIST